MKGLLVRVGVDQAFGGWNAPVDPVSGEFLFVPIPEGPNTKFYSHLERRYDEMLPTLKWFCDQNRCDLHHDLRWSGKLLSRFMHLDPDFDHLTYGDVGDRRGARMSTMSRGDILVFYSGLRPIAPCGHKLLYALIGLYVIDEVIPVHAVAKERWHQNAHSRKSTRGGTDIVVRARNGVSGRLERCIPIGEWRDRAYRVRHDLLDAWGGLSVSNGYIQRSAVPPMFIDAPRFFAWFLRQKVTLVPRNN